MKVCLSCGNYDRKFIKMVPGNIKGNEIENIYYCKHPDCNHLGNSIMIEIDNLLVDTIVLLRKYNFETGHCCEGHWLSNSNKVSKSGYISFHVETYNGILYGQPNEVYDKLIKIIPDKIGIYNLLYEEVYGPRNAFDPVMIKKIVFRFEVEDKDYIYENLLEFEKHKMELWVEFYNILKTNIDDIVKEENK